MKILTRDAHAHLGKVKRVTRSHHGLARKSASDLPLFSPVLHGDSIHPLARQCLELAAANLMLTTGKVLLFEAV